MAKPKLGSGERFKKLKAKLAEKGAKTPGALAAFIGRKKFGKRKFQELAVKGKIEEKKGKKKKDEEEMMEEEVEEKE